MQLRRGAQRPLRRPTDKLKDQGLEVVAIDQWKGSAPARSLTGRRTDSSGALLNADVRHSHRESEQDLQDGMGKEGNLCRKNVEFRGEAGGGLRPARTQWRRQDQHDSSAAQSDPANNWLRFPVRSAGNRNRRASAARLLARVRQSAHLLSGPRLAEFL